MYTAVGALEPTVKQSALDVMPSCYSQSFHDCLQEENRDAAGCRRFEPVHLAYEQDYNAMKDIVADMSYCNKLSKLQLGALVGGSVLVGVLVGAIVL